MKTPLSENNYKKPSKTVLEAMFYDALKNSPFSRKQIATYLGVEENYINECLKFEKTIDPVMFEKIIDLLGYPNDKIGTNILFPHDIDFKNIELTKEDLEAIARVNRIYCELIFSKK